MCGGIKRPVCGFPCEQYLELERRGQSAGCQASAASPTPVAWAAEVMANVVLCCCLNQHPDAVGQRGPAPGRCHGKEQQQ